MPCPLTTSSPQPGRPSEEVGCLVVVDDDVNVMVLGEHHSGVTQRTPDLLFVKIGSGIGCGVQVGGEIYRGAEGQRHRPHPVRG